MPDMAAICADTESLKHPGAIGLEDVSLDELSWLKPFSHGFDLRRALKEQDGIGEIWLLSAEDVEPINLAAALRKDGFRGIVHVVMANANGSSMSRATVAGVTDVQTPEGFVRWFSLEARRRRRMTEAASLSLADVKGAQVSMRESEGRSSHPGENARAGARSEAAPSGRASIKASANVKRGNPRHASSAAEAAQSAVACPKGNGRLIVVVGASGGVGKTTVAACLAFCAAQQGLKTLVVDGDLQFGCLYRMFGEEEPVTLDEAVADGRVIEELAAGSETGKPAILGAPHLMEKSETLSASAAGVVSSSLEWFDLVIVDTSTHWSDMQPALIEMAMCTLFLVDQRPSSMRACRHAMELCERMGLATGGFSFALNRCSKGAAISALDASYALGGVHVLEVMDAGPEAEDLCVDGAAALLASSSGAFAKSIQRLAQQVMPEMLKGIPAGGGAAGSRMPWLWYLGQGRKRRRRRSRNSNEIIVRTGTPQAGERDPSHARAVGR